MSTLFASYLLVTVIAIVVIAAMLDNDNDGGCA